MTNTTIKKQLQRMAIMSLVIILLPINGLEIMTTVYAHAEGNQTVTTVAFESEAIEGQKNALLIEHDVSIPDEEVVSQRLEIKMPREFKFDEDETTALLADDDNVLLEWQESKKMVVIESTKEHIATKLVVTPVVNGQFSVETKANDEEIKNVKLAVLAQKNQLIADEAEDKPNKQAEKVEDERVSTSERTSENFYDNVYQRYVADGYSVIPKNQYRKKYEVTFTGEDAPTEKTKLRYLNEETNVGTKLNPVVSIVDNSGKEIPYISNGGWNSNGFQLVNDDDIVFSRGNAPTEIYSRSNLYNIKKMERANDDGSHDIVTLGTSSPSIEASDFVYEMTMAPDYVYKTIKVNMLLHNNTEKTISKGLFHGVRINMNNQLGVPLHDLGAGRGMFMKSRAVLASSGGAAEPEMKLTYSLSQAFQDEKINYNATMITDYNNYAYGFSPNTPKGSGLEVKNNAYGKELVKGKITGNAYEETTTMAFKTVPRAIAPKASTNMAFNIGLVETAAVPELIVDNEYVGNESKVVEISGTWYDVNYGAGGGAIAYKTAKDSQFQSSSNYMPSRVVSSGNFKFGVPAEKLEVGANVVQLQITNKANQRTTVNTIVNVKKKVTLSYVNELGELLSTPAGYDSELYQRLGSQLSQKVPKEFDNYLFDKVANEELIVAEVDQQDNLVTGVVTKELSNIKVIYISKEENTTFSYKIKRDDNKIKLQNFENRTDLTNRFSQMIIVTPDNVKLVERTLNGNVRVPANWDQPTDLDGSPNMRSYTFPKVIGNAYSQNIEAYLSDLSFEVMSDFDQEGEIQVIFRNVLVTTDFDCNDPRNASTNAMIPQKIEMIGKNANGGTLYSETITKGLVIGQEMTYSPQTQQHYETANDVAVVPTSSVTTQDIMYQAIEYTISYDSNGGMGPDKLQQTYTVLTADVTIINDGKEFSKDNYMLTEWKDETQNKTYQLGAMLDKTNLPGNMTLQASWTINQVTMTVNYLQEVNGVKTNTAIFSDLEKQERQAAITKKVDIDATISEELNQLEQEKTFSGYVLVPDYVVQSNDPPAAVVEGDRVPNNDFTVNYYYQPRLDIIGPQSFDFGTHSLSMKKETVGLAKNGQQTPMLLINNSFEKNNRLAEWEVFVSSSGLYNETTKSHMNGTMYYKEKKGDHGVTINHEKEKVLMGNSAMKEIPLRSEDNEIGILLDVENTFNYHKGKYEGEINWVLQVAP